jgi:hypothetical protein
MCGMGVGSEAGDAGPVQPRTRGLPSRQQVLCALFDDTNTVQWSARILPRLRRKAKSRLSSPRDLDGAGSLVNVGEDLVVMLSVRCPYVRPGVGQLVVLEELRAQGEASESQRAPCGRRLAMHVTPLSRCSCSAAGGGGALQRPATYWVRQALRCNRFRWARLAGLGLWWQQALACYNEPDFRFVLAHECNTIRESR